MKVVTLKLTDSEVVAVERLVALGRMKSVSHALRQGLLLLLEKNSIGSAWVLNIEEERQEHPDRTASRSGSALWQEVFPPLK